MCVLLLILLKWETSQSHHSFIASITVVNVLLSCETASVLRFHHASPGLASTAAQIESDILEPYRNPPLAPIPDRLSGSWCWKVPDGLDGSLGSRKQSTDCRDDWNPVFPSQQHRQPYVQGCVLVVWVFFFSSKSRTGLVSVFILGVLW